MLSPALPQTFLQQTEAQFAVHPLWKGTSAEELEASGEALEKYVMTKLHHRTFAVVPEDVERDRVRASQGGDESAATGLCLWAT
jgi:hypothetical protein